jgi:uncharacterized protein YerC
MTVSTFTKTEITARRQQVAERYLRGMYMAQIAQEMGVDTATISRDLSELRKEWLDRSINHIDQKKAIELAKLDRLEVTYWDAWEQSKEDAIIRTTGFTARGAIDTTRKEGRRPGNPAFLEGVLKCIDKRCQIIGIDAPKRMDVTSKGESIKQDDTGLNRSILTLASALREAVSSQDAKQASPVDATEQTPMASPPIEGG